MSCRERIVAAARAEFLTCLEHGDFSIEHKVSVHKVMGTGGTVDYNDEDTEYHIKSIRLTRKENKDGGIESKVKIVIE